MRTAQALKATVDPVEAEMRDKLKEQQQEQERLAGQLEENKGEIESLTEAQRRHHSAGADERSSGEEAQLLGTPFDSRPDGLPATETLEESEHNHILRTLKRVNWKLEGPGGAAELLDIHPSALRALRERVELGIAEINRNAETFGRALGAWPRRFLKGD